MSKLESKLSEINENMKNLIADTNLAAEKGNKSAARRARGAASIIGKQLKELRVELLAVTKA